ncbi:MAG: GGDEF domain-containing protein [Pseudobdellovibrio sp.]
MKQWVANLLQQLDISFSDSKIKVDSAPVKNIPSVSEEKATLLYIIDIMNKHLFEIEKHSIRKVREKLDNMSKALVEQNEEEQEKTLFEIRQFFSSYRIDEYTYIQNTFDDFKRIVWDLAAQLSEEIHDDKSKDECLDSHLKELKEAVDANSLETLRKKSRDFINLYVEHQQSKNAARKKRMVSVKKNLDTVKKQLMEANNSLNLDHLTSAHNRKSFDEQIKKFTQMNKLNPMQVSIILMDIDFFKKINDSYGHDIGDFVLKECVRILKSVFHKDTEMVARIGGEEFVVILPNHSIDHAIVRAEEVQKRIRSEVFVHGDLKINFTVSMGLAQLDEHESATAWIKRADMALYESKKTGRNKYTLAVSQVKNSKAA